MPGKDQLALNPIQSQFGNNGDGSAGIARQTRLIQGITFGRTTGKTHNPDRDLASRDNEQGDRQELLNAVHGTTAFGNRNLRNLPSDARKICPVPAKTHDLTGNLARPIDNLDRVGAPQLWLPQPLDGPNLCRLTAPNAAAIGWRFQAPTSPSRSRCRWPAASLGPAPRG